MTKVSDKSSDNQSEARISVAYNTKLSFVTDDKFCETPPWFGMDFLQKLLRSVISRYGICRPVKESRLTGLTVSQRDGLSELVVHSSKLQAVLR